MATRNLTMVVDRKHAEKHKEGFAAEPSSFTDNSYVNMYLHHDGYPEFQGVQVANWVHTNGRQDGSAMAAKLVHDMYYDSCYLYPSPDMIDHQYTYIIWSGKKDIWISCYDNYNSENVFVLTPAKVISRYMSDYEYTDFANGEKRFVASQKLNEGATLMDVFDEYGWSDEYDSKYSDIMSSLKGSGMEDLVFVTRNFPDFIIDNGKLTDTINADGLEDLLDYDEEPIEDPHGDVEFQLYVYKGLKIGWFTDDMGYSGGLCHERDEKKWTKIIKDNGAEDYLY